MVKPNLVFFGSPEFSADILKEVLDFDFIRVVGVVTQPDKPLGRKQVITPSPVAITASEHNLPVYKPNRLDDDNLAHIKLLKPDIFLVISYGKIIPQSWLDLPKVGTFNIHFSLLPKYRGALCISEALRNGDLETGVTLMLMDSQLDHGPIISQSRIKIDIDDNTATLTSKLTSSAISLLKHELPIYLDGAVSAYPQDESQATVTPTTRQRTHLSAYIDFDDIQEALDGSNALKIHNIIRSLNPEPGAWTRIIDKEIKIIKTYFQDQKLIISTVQLPGKSPITWKQFTSGYLKQ